MLKLSSGKQGVINTMLSPGQLLLITGTMRSGKSNTGMFLTEKAIAKNYQIYTNVLFFDLDEIEEAIEEGTLKQKVDWYEQKHQNIHTVTTADELIRGLYNTKRNISILDEAQFYARGTNAKIVRWFKEFVTQIGKLKSSMVLLTQVKSELAPMLKSKLPTWEIKTFKISFNNRYAEIWFNPVDREPIHVDTWFHLRPSKYPYDHEAPAMFDFNIDMEKFLTKISKINSVRLRKDNLVIKILDEMLEGKKVFKNDKLTKKEKVLNKISLHPNLDTSAIAVLSDCSQRYVREIKAELKKN